MNYYFNSGKEVPWCSFDMLNPVLYRCVQVMYISLIKATILIYVVFMLHVPLDSIIEAVIAVGGVFLWVSSVCWDTH